MRRLPLIAVLLLCVLSLNAQEPDYGKLREYLGALERFDLDTKIEESDFIIGSSEELGMGLEVAVKVYEHFRNSTLMGDENVAVHVADKWILPLCSETCALADSTLAEIRTFAQFNRESLLGARAPLLPEAGLEDFGPGDSRVLFFYDFDCAKCKVEIPKLEALMDRHKELSLNVFYTGTDMQRWDGFRKLRFKGARHFSDPENESDFILKYSVTATPRMFLIDGDGFITGRMLDCDALEELLTLRKNAGKKAITELFNTLVPQRGNEAKEALEYLIDNYILCENSVFDTSEDSLMVIGFAQIQKDLLSRARPGSELPGIRVRGSLNGGREKSYRLNRLGKVVIIFHTEGCRECEAQLEAARKLGQDTFTVNMDSLERKSPKTFARLMDFFDLSVLPYLIECDGKGIVTRRYFSLTDEL
ncbi:MAG: TlpA family protein disulfide reductase [Candidatus Cryptobacteroides sp.]